MGWADSVHEVGSAAWAVGCGLGRGCVLRVARLRHLFCRGVPGEAKDHFDAGAGVDWVAAFASVAAVEPVGWCRHGDWAVKHGASASLPQAPKGTCRSWAAAVFEQLGDRVDGLLVPSTVVGDESLVLFARAQSAFPSAPAFSRTLDHDSVRAMAVKVRDRLNWPIH